MSHHLTVRRLAALALLALLLPGLAAAPALAGGNDRATDTSRRTAGRLEVQPPGATRTRVATFNVLGAGHTDGAGGRKGWASGEQRMHWAVDLIHEHELDLIGFQELQKPQFRVFRKLTSTEYGVFPGAAMGTAAMQNSVAWNLSEWRAVEKRTVKVPYFDGNMISKPLVRLQSTATGQQVWLFNTHNPADAHGDAQEWRDKAVRIESRTVNGLRQEFPGVPVFFTGDMNDRDKFYCPITARTELESASGGWNDETGCQLATPTKVDWVMGTPDAPFTGYTIVNQGLIEQVTDHSLIYADATISSPSARAAGIQHVLVLDVSGMSSRALRKAGPEAVPHITRLMSEGASTLNARPSGRLTPLPNLISILTGRRPNLTHDGHGITSDTDTGSTVAAAAGRYVSTAFDLVHNYGRTTGLFYSDPDTDLVARSWGETYGGGDPFGHDDGRSKFTVSYRGVDDTDTVTDLTQLLDSGQVPALTLLQLSSLDAAGHESGFLSRPYLDQLSTVDDMVGQVMTSIRSGDAADDTLVVLTADAGGHGTTHGERLEPSNFKLPLAVWGQPVVHGGHLYAINPAYTNPRKEITGWRGPQPIRTSMVANLATSALNLPVVPGSEMNPLQQLNVFVGPTS